MTPPYIEFECGCRLEHHAGDLPLRAWECEHGNSIRARDPVTGEQIRQYEEWLRTDEARDYFRQLSIISYVDRSER